MSPTEPNRLARICAYSTQAPEWELFVHMVTPVVALSARRVGSIWGDASVATVNEIVQEVFLKLCEDERRILREFEDRGVDSFVKLLRVIAASVATDYFRKTRAEKRGGANRALPLEAFRVEEDLSDGDSTRAVEWPTLMAQLDGLLRLYPDTISERDRQLFWFYYRHGLTADAIARIPAMDLTAKGVESALRRMVLLLRQTIVNGKPGAKLQKNKLLSTPKVKGFASVVAIDNVKRQ